MSQVELIALISLFFTLFGVGLTLYIIFTEFPKFLWAKFKDIREKEAEEVKSKLLESEERDKYEAWRRSRQGVSSPSSSSADKSANSSSSSDSDDLDIHNPDNWYE